MIRLVIAAALLVVGLVLLFLKIQIGEKRDPETGKMVPRRVGMQLPGLAAMALSVAAGAWGSVAFNDAGYCVHIRTIFGGESNKCSLGWYFLGWGNTTAWPHYITISNTGDLTAEGSSIRPPYPIRMADNWNGLITQTTRFGIPQDSDQFIKMARDFRSPERLITSTLVPAVTASLDSVANLYTMEEYYAGGARDAFKTEFRDTVIKGRAVVDREERVIEGPQIDPFTAPSDASVAADTAVTGSSERVRFVTTKRLDASGNEIRIPHGYADYGVVVSTAILTNLDPDDDFEAQIKDRKDAEARRIVAVSQRLEQEEQRLLAVADGERRIAERQADARVNQIQQTTDAETQKRLALIAATQRNEQAEIERRTSEINLAKARIDAEAIEVTADAQAYERQALLEADNALQIKVDAEVAIQRVWADAYSRRQVPQLVFGAGDDVPVGGDTEVSRLMDLLTADAAKRLAYDRGLAPLAPSNRPVASATR